MSIQTREIDYQPKVVNHPSYMFDRRPPQTNAGSAIAVTTGGNEVTFELPPNVMNLSKSRLRYTLKCTGQANKATVLFGDTIPEIQSISLHTRGGLMLCDLKDANKYLASTLRHETPLTEAMENDLPVNGAVTTIANVSYKGYWEGLCMPQCTVTNVADNANTLTTIKDVVMPHMINNGAGGTADPSVFNISNFHTPVYAISKSVTPTATAAENDLYVRRNIPLSIFHDTIFSVDKDLYFNDTMYLKIVFENANKVFFTCTSTLAFAARVVGDGYAVGVAGNYINLFLAIETNKDIEMEVRRKVQSGSLNMMIPYVWGNTITVGGDRKSLVVRYNAGQGKKLKRILWVPFNNVILGTYGAIAGTAGTREDSYNHNNGIITAANGQLLRIRNFYCLIGPHKTTQFDINCETGDDYLIQKERLKGTCINTYDQYLANFRWEENFAYDSAYYADLFGVPRENLVDGIDLKDEVIFDIEAVTADQSFNNIFFATVLRELNITAGGVTLM